MTEFTLMAGIIAVVQAIKSQAPGVNGLVTLAVALGLGALAGYMQLLNTPDVLSGMFMGAAAVGTMTVASKAGGN